MSDDTKLRKLRRTCNEMTEAPVAIVHREGGETAVVVRSAGYAEITDDLREALGDEMSYEDAAEMLLSSAFTGLHGFVDLAQAKFRDRRPYEGRLHAMLNAASGLEYEDLECAHEIEGDMPALTHASRAVDEALAKVMEAGLEVGDE